MNQIKTLFFIFYVLIFSLSLSHTNTVRFAVRKRTTTQKVSSRKWMPPSAVASLFLHSIIQSILFSSFKGLICEVMLLRRAAGDPCTYIYEIFYIPKQAHNTHADVHTIRTKTDTHTPTNLPACMRARHRKQSVTSFISCCLPC